MSTNNQPTKGRTEELNQDELKNTTGGSLLGGDDNMLTAITEGHIGLSQTDDDGDTSSTNLDFGSGSLLNSQND